MARSPAFLFVAVQLLLCCLSAHLYAQPGEDKKVPVSAAAVQEQAIVEHIAVTGSVTSPHVAALSPAVGGLVTRVAVDAGATVKRGASLLSLDEEIAGHQLAAAEARAEKARRELTDAQRRLREARALAADKSIAESTVKDLAAEVEIDAVTLQQANAQVDRQAAILARHRLQAPFAGVITRRQAAPGEWVNPGDTVLELVALSGLRIDVRLPDDHLPRLREIMAEGPTLSVPFTLDALPDRIFAGEIAALVPVSDPSSRSFLLRLTPREDHDELAPGMLSRVRVPLPTGRRALVIPRDALLRHPDGRTSVWVVARKNGAAVAREHFVTVGKNLGENIEIRSGLSAGAQVITRGNEALRDGLPLRVSAPQ